MSADSRLEALLARAKAVTLQVATGRMRGAPVARSRDLDRILALPVTSVPSPEDRRALREALTLPGAELCLWDLQCDALLEALRLSDRVGAVDGRSPGLYAPIAVGGGKTLITALLGAVWGSERPLILTTAALARQTEIELARYRRSFAVPEKLTVMSYSIFSHADHADDLEAHAPDAIICDEAHALISRESARGKRLRRYLKEHPQTRLALLSGTVARRSILEWAELAGLALGEWSPAPRDRQTRIEWSEALDPDDSPRGAADRHVGALTMLLDRTEQAQAANLNDPTSVKDVTRKALARRVRQSPGVIASDDETPDVPLAIRIVDMPETGMIERARTRLAQTWERPDGEELVTAVEIAEVDRQLRLGGFLSWSVEPDREWLRLRREYKKAQRAWLVAHPRNEIDSPERLARALARGEIDDFALTSAWALWMDAKDSTTEPPKEWREIDPTPACVWAAVIQYIAPIVGFGRHVEFARRVAEISGAPYFGAGREDARKILEEQGQRSIVASLGAHGMGRNLQTFSTAAIFDPSSAGADWEQHLGRLHRPGQKHARVTYLVSSQWRGEVERALADAQWLALSLGQPQRMIVAEKEGWK